jgi:hypothetical protein
MCLSSSILLQSFSSVFPEITVSIALKICVESKNSLFIAENSLLKIENVIVVVTANCKHNYISIDLGIDIHGVTIVKPSVKVIFEKTHVHPKLFLPYPVSNWNRILLLHVYFISFKRCTF